MKIKNIAISKVKPANYNPREITEYAIKGLVESLKQYGFVEPLIINTQTGNLVGGHQRLKAAEMLGMQEVPVTEVSLSLAQEKALNVTLNNHAIQGVYTESLQDLLAEISTELPDIMCDLRLEDLMLDMTNPFDDEPQGNGAQGSREISQADLADSPARKEKKKVKCPSCGVEF